MRPEERAAKNVAATLIQAVDPERKFRVRRGALVEIPSEWIGQTTSTQKIRQRASKHHRRRSTKHDAPCGAYRGGANRVPRDRQTRQGHASKWTTQKPDKRPPRAWPRSLAKLCAAELAAELTED